MYAVKFDSRRDMVVNQDPQWAKILGDCAHDKGDTIEIMQEKACRTLGAFLFSIMEKYVGEGCLPENPGAACR